MTLRERFIAALVARGSVVVNGRSDKVTTLTRPRREGTFYFVGRAGSLRFGRIYSRSLPCNDTFKNLLLNGE